MADTGRKVGGEDMLIGGSKHTIDAKGRMFFPARFRDDMWENITVCRGVDKCLMLYTPEEWAEFSRRIKEQPFPARCSIISSQRPPFAASMHRAVCSSRSSCAILPASRKTFGLSAYRIALRSGISTNGKRRRTL